MLTNSTRRSTDNDKGKTFNSPDRPLAGREAIVFLANGTEYYRTKLDSDGELRFVPKVPCPSCPLRIALASNPTEKLQTFYTDSEGNARFDVPIPPKLPVISGKVWFDTDNDKAVTSGDVPLAGKKMLLVMANGTVYHQTTLDADGSFVYPPTSGSPNLPLKLVDAAIPSKVYGTFRTDLEGNGRIDVPIPPTPVVAGRVWLDNDKNDKAAGTSDVDLAGEPINLLRPDDTIFMSSTLDARGSFVYNPPVAEPNLRLRIVLAAEPKKTLALLLTDAKGNGRVDVPIPPVLPTVSGQIWWDNDDNKAMSSGDQPLRGEPVVLLRPDGSIFCSTSLGIDGSMTYFPDKAEPNLRLTVVLVSDPTRVLGGLTTDPAGNGRFDIPIPPPNNPVAQTSIATATTTPLASAPPPATSSNVPVPITTNKAPIFVPTTAPLPIQMTTKAPVPVPTTAPLLVRTTAKAALTTAKLVVPQTTAKAILTTSKTVLTTKKINALTVSLPRGTSTKIRTTSTTTTTRVAGAAISGFVFTGLLARSKDCLLLF